MATDQNYKLKAYYFTAVLSLVFAVLGFSYNAWRLEVTEDNSNIRTASFEVLNELAELQQIIFAAHYDKDPVAGSPRTGWVKIGLITDLSALINPSVQTKAEELKTNWSDNWNRMVEDRDVTNQLIDAISAVREEIKITLGMLK